MSASIKWLCFLYDLRFRPLSATSFTVPRQHPLPLDGWWTYPYFSCPSQKWLLSYSLIIPPSAKGHYSDLSGLISIDIEISDLRVNQCPNLERNINKDVASHLHQDNDIEVFHNSHKCHRSNMKVISVFPTCPFYYN